MDAFLTLVIALGGIATGIGAIWTAVAARRQAQLSERSLTQSERSLSEQIQTLREQNERARLTLEYDLLERQAARFDNPQWRRTVKAAAKFTLDNVFVDDEVVAAERLNYPASEVCNFYEGVGEMLRLGVLRHALVWNRYSIESQAFWRAFEPTIEKIREQTQDPTLFEDFEYLNRAMAEMDRKRGLAPSPRESMRQMMEDTAAIDEAPPTTTRE